MSLSPWDLTGNVSFSIAQLYRPRRPSYVFATQTTRQRSGSYQHATGSLEAEEEEEEGMVSTTEADFIDNLVRRKQKQRSLSVQQSHYQYHYQHQHHHQQQQPGSKNLLEQQYFSHQQLPLHPSHGRSQPQTPGVLSASGAGGSRSNELQLRIHFSKQAEEAADAGKPPIKSASMGNSFLPDASTPLARHQASDFSLDSQPPMSALESRAGQKDMKLSFSNNRCFSPRDLTPLVSHNRSATPDSGSGLNRTTGAHQQQQQPFASRSLSFTNRNSFANSRQSHPLANKFDQQNLHRLESEDVDSTTVDPRRAGAAGGGRRGTQQQQPQQQEEEGEESRRSRHPTAGSGARGSKWRYTKNLVVLSLGFILVFTAFRSVQNLQSSINTEGRLGVFSMSLVHATTFVSCLFAPILVEKLSSKWTIVVGLVFYLFWIAANFFPHVSTLFPTSIGVGFGQSLAWGAQVSYIERLAVDYSHLSKELTQQELYKFNGIFLACFQSSHIWGNLVSSLMITDEDLVQKPSSSSSPFSSSSSSSSYHSYFHPDGGNGSDPFEMDDVMYLGSDFEQRSCGVYDICTDRSLADLWNSSKRPVEPAARNILKLMASYLVFASVGFLLIFFLLEKVNSKSTSSSSDKTYPQGILTNLRHLSGHKTYRFLVPLLVFNGFEQGFVYSDYTKSYIRCTVGVQYVGYNMITLGMTNSIFSIGLGVVSRHIAREAIVGIGCVLHLGILVFLLVWIPGPNLVPVFFVISALWGLCDAIWQTQCNCLVNLSCPNDHDVAFQVFRMLQGLGATMAFLLSGLTCVSSKLYVLICLLVLAIVSYVFVENRLRRPECFQSSSTATAATAATSTLAAQHQRVTPLRQTQESKASS